MELLLPAGCSWRYDTLAEDMMYIRKAAQHGG